MARTLSHAPVAPELPAGPVDFNALHDAIMAGKSADKALSVALLDPLPDEEPAQVELTLESTNEAKDVING